MDYLIGLFSEVYQSQGGQSLGKRTRFFSPYVKGKPAMKAEGAPASGVYFIREKKTGKVVYIGYSERQLRRTIYRHFQAWNDKRQERFTYNPEAHQVRLIITTPGRARILEKYLILKAQPRDNSLKYENYLSEKQEERAEEVLSGLVDIGNNESPF